MSGLADRPILYGTPSATEAQARAYLARTNAAHAKARGIPPFGAAEIATICAAYWRIGARYGIDPTPALAQSVHETGAYTFGGQVSAAQHNPAGLGATNDGAAGGGWPDWPHGIEAHYIHLLCWCNDPHGDGDYRFDAVRAAIAKQGKATSWRSLGGRWAVPGVGYGDAIETIWAAIIAEKGGSVAPTIIDVRALLPTSDTGGRADKFGPKKGIIVHYSGPAVNRNEDTLTALRSYAAYHIGPYLGERGLAYHYDIGNDAKTRMTRDPDAILWHCASWPENAEWYSVHVMLGDGQRASPAQLQALGALCLYLSERDGFSDGNVKGHQEVSATSCPGNLMGDFVLPWRAGTFALMSAAVSNKVEVIPVSNYVKFPETGKGIQNGFRDYWESQGGLRHFGLPLTEEIQEACADGVTRTVQYFERARFEWHPDAAAGYTIQESRLGAVAAKVAGLHGAGID